MRIALLAVGAVPALSAARAPDVRVDPDGPSHVLNLRAGASSTDTNGRPAICLEVAPVWIVSVEACGTGQGFLHDAPGRELAHFRAKLAVHSAGAADGALAIHLGLGFAELQIGDDDPGFVFSRRDPVEVAGPEASLAFQQLLFVTDDVEAVANASVGIAWLPHASGLRVPASEWQPFAALEVGVGF